MDSSFWRRLARVILLAASHIRYFQNRRSEREGKEFED